jgi:WD40 repeat protein
VVTSEAFRTLVAWPADVSDQICEWTSVSPDGQWVLSARAGVRLWDLRNEKALAYLPIGFTESALVHPSGRALITVGEAGVLLWPLRREAEVLRIGPPENLVPESHKRPCHAALSADGRTLVVAANDGAAQVLDLEKRDAVRSVGPHENMFFVAASPDGRWAATGTWGGTGVKVWDLRRAALARELPIPAPAKVAWSPDGKWLVTSETEYVIWDTETWHAIARFPRPNYMGVPGPIAFAPDGRILALVGDDPEIELRDLATFAVIARLACPLPIPVRSLAFTPDGERLFLPNPKGHIVHCWDLRAVRGPLATMGLDWNLPAYAARPVNDPVSPLRAEVDLGPLAP